MTATAKIYLMQTPAGTRYVTMSPDGDQFHQFSYLSAAELYATLEYGDYMVVQ